MQILYRKAHNQAQTEYVPQEYKPLKKHATSSQIHLKKKKKHNKLL